MSKELFTKGQWVVADYTTGLQESNRSLAVWPVPHDRKPICLVTPKGTETEIDIANAALIASAPELYEALKELVELKRIKDGQGKTGNYLSRQPIAWQKAEAAILKAVNV